MSRLKKYIFFSMYGKRDPAILVALIILLPILVIGVQVVRNYLGRAYVPTPANIIVYADRPVGPLPHTWRALAQGGEEKGVRMLNPVVDNIAELSPRYIRIDHIYDFYDVVERDARSSLIFNWSDLDQTICDILQSGAKPFLSLGYMPETMSTDATIIGAPRDWSEWELLVQKTIERYSGINSIICGRVFDQNLDDVYYEVWNEPDLESFGAWNIHGGEKDYKLLYYYAAKGAEKARDTRRFFIGGPAITAAYQNWFQLLIKYVDAYDLRMDFISWHHYGSDVDKFAQDMRQIDFWLKDSEYDKYRSLPRVISEWGFDSGTNPISETNIGAAHTVSAIRYLIEEDLEMAFAFEIKDGLTPRWGILSYEGEKKPRFHALKMLNVLGYVRLDLEGEGSYVKAIASRKPGGVSVVLVNYDIDNQYSQVVPFTIEGLTSGKYTLTRERLSGEIDSLTVQIPESGRYSELVSMEPNSIVSLDLIKIYGGDGEL